jgi:hypothetical protein
MRGLAETAGLPATAPHHPSRCGHNELHAPTWIVCHQMHMAAYAICFHLLCCRFTADEETRFLKGVDADKTEALRRLHVTAVRALHQHPTKLPQLHFDLD